MGFGLSSFSPRSFYLMSEGNNWLSRGFQGSSAGIVRKMWSASCRTGKQLEKCHLQITGDVPQVKGRSNNEEQDHFEV
jgi:hypothetical protein